MAEALRPLPEAIQEGPEEWRRAAPADAGDQRFRMRGRHAALVLDDVPRAGPTLYREVLEAHTYRDIDAVEAVVAAADVVVERAEVVELVDLGRIHIVERQRVAAAVREQRVQRHLVRERIEIGRRESAVDRGLQVAPAAPDVIDLHRDPRRDLLGDTGHQIPAVLPSVPAISGGWIDGERRDRLPEERIAGAALAVGCRAEQIAVDTEVAVTISPRPRVLRNEVSESGRAVIDPFVDGVERRGVSAQE